MLLQVICAVGSLAVVVTPAFYDSEKGRDEWEKIVGGSKAENGSAPYQASLRLWGVRHFCGGAVVTPRVILTAAHCVDGLRPQYFTATVGSNQLRAGGASYAVRRAESHRRYDADLVVNDIAVLFTERAMRLGAAVQPVELNDEPVAAGEQLLLTGWGTTSYPGQIPNDLMRLQLRAVALDDCREALKDVNAVFDSQLCALAGGGEGACHGDSGGPLVREGRLVGIVSWGVPCARGKPDVYTKVEAFMDWIERTLREDDEDHLAFIERRRGNFSFKYYI